MLYNGDKMSQLISSKKLHESRKHYGCLFILQACMYNKIHGIEALTKREIWGLKEIIPVISRFCIYPIGGEEVEMCRKMWETSM